jgi:hypothetical protein
MCTNPQKTLIDLMAEIEPSLVSLGTEAGISSSPLFQDVIKEYNASLEAIQNWTSGTPAQDAIEVINDFEDGVQALPIPDMDKNLINVILAAVATVIAVLSANSPTPEPIPAGADATSEETQAQYQADVIEAASAEVKQLVPGFKRSKWHSPASQYKSTWNSAIKAGGFPNAMLLK